MAAFAETLADSGIVTDACAAAGMTRQAAYARRRRDPLFAAVWQAALCLAREQLADTLLARSIEGHAEYYYRDGELVGEKRVIDGRLGLAILKRLDRLAEQFPGEGRGAVGAAAGTGRRRERKHPPAIDFEKALAALQGDDPALVAEALEMLGHAPEEPLETPEVDTEVDEVDDTWIHPLDSDDFSYDAYGDRWWTRLAPPPGFTGVEEGEWGTDSYRRLLAPEEEALVLAALVHDAEEAAAKAAERRDAVFDRLRTLAFPPLPLRPEERAEQARLNPRGPSPIEAP